MDRKWLELSHKLGTPSITQRASWLSAITPHSPESEKGTFEFVSLTLCFRPTQNPPAEHTVIRTRASRHMLSITEHHDSDLSREEIVAVCSLVYRFWPSKDKTIDDVVEAFPETGKQYGISYPQVRLPSLRYLIWNKDLAVAHALTFERPLTTSAGEFSVMALAGVCVLPSYQGRGLGAEIVRRAFGRIDAGEFAVSLFQTTIPAFYEKLGATFVANRFVNSRHKNHPEANPWYDEWVMIYPKSYAWPEGTIDLNGPGY